MGGMGGAGGFGLGLAPAVPGVEAPLHVEGALPPIDATIDKSKRHKLYRDKRTPIRGSLLPNGAGKTNFVPHTAKNVASVGNGSSFVVAGATGLWLHDSKDLSKQKRLVAGPVHDVATSPDGRRIAFYLAPKRLRVATYPDLTPIVTTNVDLPVRMRFSSDGRRLAIGSESDTVTLVDIDAGGKTTVIDTEEDVNDAYPMPDKTDEVAYASDEDEVVILNMSSSNRVFSSEQHVMNWRNTKKPFFLMRDQLAVAYDSVTETLLAGGDDNMFWRFSHLRTTPKLENPIELNGNIVDMACCAGRTAADRAVFIAIDNVQVKAVSLDGRLGPTFGPLAPSPVSSSIRISLLPSGDVLVAAMSALFRWEPRSGITLQSNDYLAAPAFANAVEADTIYVPCDQDGCVVHRVVRGPTPVADIETSIIGELPPSTVQAILDFSTGLRAIVLRHDNVLQLAYLPVGGSLEPLVNTKVTPGGYFAKRDTTIHGYVDPSGKVYEIAAVPREMRQVAMALGKGNIIGLGWDASTSKWRVQYTEGNDVFVP
jgi:hypothetical protein